MTDQAIVSNIVRETQDSVVVSLCVTEEQQNNYLYKQGQNLTLIRDIDGVEVRRSYSICSSVEDAELRVGVKRVEGGRFSTWANSDLAVGDVIDVLPPTGNFFVELDASNQRHYIGIVAGSGITPVLSIMKTTLETEPRSHFTLIYGNKSTDTIMFLEEIEALKNRYTERLSVFNVLSQELQDSELLSGRIDGDKIGRFLGSLIPADEIDEVFLCGPLEMVTSTQRTLVDAGIDSKHVHTELFGTPKDLHAIASAQKKPTLSDAELAHLSELTVIVNGKGTRLRLARGGESVLETALKVRGDLPYACKGGVCATCKAKVVEGEVEMDVNYSLSEEEVKQGFVLTCQSHPISDKVTIDYDQK